MRRRYEYRLTLTSALVGPPPAADGHGNARHPTPDDREALAALLLDAYRGTIDADGSEGLDEARHEVDSYRGGEEMPPLLDSSWVYDAGGELAAACLVALWPRRGCPLVAYMITRAARKRRGLARRLVQLRLTDLLRAGYPETRAVITEGNEPSKRLYARLGFEHLT